MPNQRSSSPPSPIELSELEATPPAGSLIVKLDELPEHGGKEIIYTEDRFRTSIFVQKSDEGVEVFLNLCPHAGTPLNLFDDRFLDLKGKSILCRTHGALFDTKSGKCTRGPCKGEYLRKVAHVVKEGAIYSV